MGTQVSRSWKYGISFCLTLVALCTVWMPTACGQTATGQIQGRITDPSGGAVPQAEVVAINVATNIKRVVQSDAAGLYTIPLLMPGLYRLTVTKTGFKPVKTPNLKLNVNQTLAQDVTLSLGTVTQVVEVKAQSDMIQTATSELGTVVGQKVTHDLPLNGRNFSQLLSLVPGITTVSTMQTQTIGAGWDTNTLGLPTSTFVVPSISGQYNRSNQYLLDGVNNTEFNDGNWVIPPIVDAIQEFKVQFHNDKAEYGSVLGGVVNVITKSGTNSLHGSAYEFVRNNAFDARNPFTDEFRSSPATFRQNQFGGTVGGPIVIPKLYNGRNRTFFFFGFEGNHYTQATESRAYVPTAAELQGNFENTVGHPNIYDPATTRPDPNHPGEFIRDQFQYNGLLNVIPPDRIDPKVQGFIQKYFDTPNLTGDPVHNILYPFPLTIVENQYNGRVDEQLGNKDTLFFRWSEFDATTKTRGYKSYGETIVPARQIGAGWTHTFSPSLFMQALGGYNQRPFYPTSVSTVGAGPALALGFPSTGGNNISLSSPWGGAGYSTMNAMIGSPAWNVTTSLTWVHGRHNFMFGLQWLRQGNDNRGAESNSYSFSNAQTDNPELPGTTGASLASALLGLPSQTNITPANRFEMRYSTWSEYAQDEWTVSNNVTVNYGLRFDLRRPVGSYSRQSFIGGAVPNGDYWIGLNQMPGLCSVVGKAPCLPAPLSQIPYGNHIQLSPEGIAWGPKVEWDDWGPRLGVAWRMNNKMVIRSGFGILYDPLSGIDQDWKGLQGEWPAASGLWRIESWNNLGNPVTTIEQTFGKSGTPLPTSDPWSQMNWWFDPNHKDSRSVQWNTEIQRQMTDNLALSIGYEGSRSDREDRTGLWNTATTPGPGTPAQVNARRPFPWWNGTSFMGTSTGISTFNALEVKLDRRFANGFYGLVSYTWSKSMDNGSSGWVDFENGVNFGGQYQNYYDPKGSRSVSGYDITHSLALSGVYELPFGRGKRYFSHHGAASWLLGNWQMNGIVTARSGQPYGIFVTGDVANIGNTVGWFPYARPNLVGNPNLSNPTSAEYFNTSAFAAPSFSYGNLGRNTMRSAPVFLADYSLFKNFPVSERMNLSFRAEFFNLFNIQNYAPPDAQLGDPGFGRVFGTTNYARQIQFALRLTF